MQQFKLVNKTPINLHSSAMTGGDMAKVTSNCKILTYFHANSAQHLGLAASTY